MSHCPSCDYPLPSDRERLGARCPNCRDPLYEPRGHIGRAAREGEGSCAVHTGVETVGICARCGNYLCEVCWTPWRGLIICAACLQQALGTREAAPEASRQGFVQALLSVSLGVGASVLSLVDLLLVRLAGLAGGQGGQVILVLLALALLAAAVVMAVFGIGNAASVLRVRGGSTTLAVIGLLICCVHIGVVIGIFTVSIWQS